MKKKCMSVIDSVFLEILRGERRTKTVPFSTKQAFIKDLSEIEFYNTAMLDRLTVKVTSISRGDVPQNDVPTWQAIYRGKHPTTNQIRIDFGEPIYSQKGNPVLKAKYEDLAKKHLK